MEVSGADSLLKYNDSETYVYFHKQPSTPEETAIAEETMAVCPQTAIANDGE
jgi:membrane-bound lytic murein transglycosylase